MNSARFLIPALFLCALLAATGCTTTTGPATPATPAPVAPLSSLALSPSDLPPGWVLSSSREKSAAEMSQLAMDLGWQGGYVAEFTNSTAGPGNQDIILQSITTYPRKNIPDIIAVVDRQDRYVSDMTVTDLTAPGIGDTSGGFTAKVWGVQVVESNTMVPLPTGPVVTGPAPSGTREDFAEVYFSKDTTFEVIRMTGPHSSGAAVISLARTAYNKIP